MHPNNKQTDKQANEQTSRFQIPTRPRHPHFRWISDAVVGRASSTEGIEATGVGGASFATEGGRKPLSPLVLAFASGQKVYAFLIAHTPYHTYGLGNVRRE